MDSFDTLKVLVITLIEKINLYAHCFQSLGNFGIVLHKIFYPQSLAKLNLSLCAIFPTYQLNILWLQNPG